MRLLILSNVIHFRHQGRLYAYGAYAREIEVWAGLFREVRIAAPCREAPPNGLAAPFASPNISIAPQLEVGGNTLTAKLRLLWKLPALLSSIWKEMLAADAVHVRCPGSFGLIGAALAPLCSRYVVAKYAGQWNGYPGEPWTVRLQRRILRSCWFGGPVTVYGEWPGQQAHVVSFFTSVLTAGQLARARRAAEAKRFHSPLRALFVGRLSASKNVDVLLHAIARLRAEGLDIACTVVGDGPERGKLEALAAQLGIVAHAAFTGGLDLERVMDCYERSHFLVLASETEGWPKAIAEAMAFGLICVGSDRGLVPTMLAKGRGFVVPPRDLGALVSTLRSIAADPASLKIISARAAAWSRQYSLEGLGDALRTLLARFWMVSPQEPARTLEIQPGEVRS